MKLENLAYAKLNLSFDRDAFIKEYDEIIEPTGIRIANSLVSIAQTNELNAIWGMIPPEEYNKGDYYLQGGNATTHKLVKRDHPQWIMAQLMEFDQEVTDPILLKYEPTGGPGFRNETLDYKFRFKPQFENLEIVKWIKKNIPYEKLNYIHCVSLPENGMSSIHRDAKGMFDPHATCGVNKVFKSGFVTICINLTSGGVPFYFSLDGKDMVNAFAVDDDVYISNDYFLHGVPITTSKRRQIRITCIPKPELLDLICMDHVVDTGDNYEYDPRMPIKGVHY